MNSCKYLDCDWCCAPIGVKTNANLGECINPNNCPYLKSQNQMTNEIDISKVLIEGDEVTIMGIKYKRVEPPKPQTLFDVIRNLGYSVDMCYEILDAVKEWLPDEVEVDTEEYNAGWNDCLKVIGNKLR
jgi:hypothetical protein